jgi:hypothetical protein
MLTTQNKALGGGRNYFLSNIYKDNRVPSIIFELISMGKCGKKE